jgi:YHS domain-containing protein
MKSRGIQFGALVLISLLLIGVCVLTGCKKKSKPAPAPESEKAVSADSAEIEQTICPVMGGAINKDIFTEYKGKKVYFCCAGCKEKFEEEPEKYISKLPRFSK